jgi:urea transport system substrate-binding protein
VLSESVKIALFVPTSGSAGLWGPSAIACAQLAAEELNQCNALRLPIELSVFNAADEAQDLAQITRRALDAREIDAIVGMHTSSVRNTVKQAVASRVPFVYTPLYEGGEHMPGVYTIGEQPQQQLRPALSAMVQTFRCKRWMFVGNDYIWPRVSHRLASHYLRDLGATLLDDVYLSFGTSDFGPLFDRLNTLKPDALLMSLVGQDAIDFNRQFGQLGLSRNTMRLSCAVEENGLLAMGAGNTEGLFVASGYFASLRSEANLAFTERYFGRFGQRAPSLNALGQSTYEGVHFAAGLMQQQARFSTGQTPSGASQPAAWRSVRGGTYLDNQHCAQPVYLAQAQGLDFEVVQAL